MGDGLGRHLRESRNRVRDDSRPRLACVRAKGRQARANCGPTKHGSPEKEAVGGRAATGQFFTVGVVRSPYAAKACKQLRQRTWSQ